METRLYENMNNISGEVISDEDLIIDEDEIIDDVVETKPQTQECISDEDNTVKTPYPFMSDDGRIYCQECGKTFKSITQSHLKLHNMTTEQYKRKYNVSMLPDKLKEHMRLINTKKYKELFKEKENIKPQTEPETTIDDLELIEDEIQVDDIISKDELDNINEISFDQNFKDLKPVNQHVPDPMYAKTEIAYNLEELLGDNLCVENYFIEEYSGCESFMGSRHLKYSFITDIAIPNKKIAFFFPDAYWHNREVAPDPNKNTKLKEDGWIVIEIKGNAPNMNQIKEKLRSANVI